MTIKETVRYYNTLKYLRAGQTLGRVWAAAKKKLGLISTPSVPAALSGRLYRATEFLYHDPWNDPGKMCGGKFIFLNVERDLGIPVEWGQNTAPLLWQYNLHYFNYLYLLSPPEREKLCLSWIAVNSYAARTSWDPYPLSLRIVNWCKCYMKSEPVNRNLYLQAAYLYRTLESYHPGNHYLENAKALIFAGLYFGGAGESQDWLKKGIDIIMSETPRQVLSDGCYFEKTVMYHSIMLAGYLDIINVLKGSINLNEMKKIDAVGVIGYLGNIASMMAGFLTDSLHPDGSIALFNDSTDEIAPQADNLISYGRRVMGDYLEHFPAGIKHPPAGKGQNSGYYTVKSGPVYCIIDGGDIGPDFLPAHAHADIFSYEASFGGIKFIVDAGVYEYEAGRMREYVRSTKAHNTFCVDGQDQAECWGSFRVARRYPPRRVCFTENDRGYIFKGEFNGYSKLIGDNLSCQRNIEFDNKGNFISICDWLGGQGSHLFESFIHFHPDVKIIKYDRQIMAVLQGAAIMIEAAKGDIRVEKGWYCPRFGVRIENNVAVISAGGQLPLSLEYKILY